MAAAGEILVQTLKLVERMIRPGVRTEELDAAAERFIRSHGATPTFKGFRGFPGSICASPNAMVVHGIPGRYRLEEGDIISVDVGVTLDGWVADAARTFPVGEIGARRAEPAARHPRVAVRRGGAVSCRRPHGRRLARDRAGGRDRGAVGRALAGGARGGSQHARGPAGSQLRPAGQGPAAGGGDGVGDRADDDRGAPRGARGGRRVGGVLPGRLAGGTLRVHGRDHRWARGCSRRGTCRERRRADANGMPPPPRWASRSRVQASCYYRLSARTRRRFVLRAYPRPGSGGRPGSQSPVAGPEGGAVGRGRRAGPSSQRKGS